MGRLAGEFLATLTRLVAQLTGSKGWQALESAHVAGLVSSGLRLTD